MALTGKQRQHLRALAHHLDPVVQVGHEGLTDAVVQQIREALEAHELIKVRVGQESPVGRDELAEALESRGVGQVAQAIGRIVVVWRRRAKKPKVDLAVGKRKASAKASKKPVRLGAKARSKGRPHLRKGARKKKTSGRGGSRGNV
jgi:RNA-binding protein